MMVHHELFLEEQSGLRCAVCGLSPVTSRTGPVCERCRSDPQRAIEQADLTLASFVARQRSAARRAQDAWDALTEEERRRWEAYQEALMRQQAGEALPHAVERRLAATIKAYEAQDLSLLTHGLLAMDSAQRLLDAANADAREAETRHARKLAALRAACGGWSHGR